MAKADCTSIFRSNASSGINDIDIGYRIDGACISMYKIMFVWGFASVCW